jgi:hypothetical protein
MGYLNRLSRLTKEEREKVTLYRVDANAISDSNVPATFMRTVTATTFIEAIDKSIEQFYMRPDEKLTKIMLVTLPKGLVR